MDDLDAVKTGAIFVLGLSAIGAAALSRHLHKTTCCTPFVGMANCFASGVFLAVGLTHLLPEGAEVLEEEVDSVLHFGYIMAIVGYMILLYFDRVLTSSHAGHGEISPSSPMQARSRSSPGEVLPMNANSPDGKNDKTGTEETAKPSVSMMGLWIALIIHSVIEGMAIGLQEHAEDALSVAVGVLLHKIPAAVSLGIRVKDAKPVLAWGLIATFSVASPLGIVIGLSLEHLEDEILIGVLMSICAGTFIYIACSEIIVDEFSSKERGQIKFLMLVVGTLVFILLSQFATEGDDHGH